MLDTFVISLQATYIDRLTHRTESCRYVRASMQRMLRFVAVPRDKVTYSACVLSLCAITHWEEEGTAGYGHLFQFYRFLSNY
jgi:hypothetical protein